MDTNLIDTEPQPEEPRPAAQPRRYLLNLPGSVLYALLAFAAGIGLGFALWGGRPPVAQAQNATLADVVLDDDPSLGPAGAPITIVEFSDFECPYCRKWQNEVWPQIQEAYEGQVRLVYRDFPLLSIHPGAVPAAEAANCAGEQDRYWEYHEVLFTTEASFSSESFSAFAEQIGLDRERFETCLAEATYRPEVAKDYQDGTTLGITGTPTFFVNGYRVVGALPFDSFKQVIDQALEQGQ